MFNQTIQHPYVVFHKTPHKSKFIGSTIAASKEEAIDKIVPKHISQAFKKELFRARRNIIHRVYTTL